jgi:hypothetical protein
VNAGGDGPGALAVIDAPSLVVPVPPARLVGAFAIGVSIDGVRTCGFVDTPLTFRQGEVRIDPLS